jgi:1-acyl-sn-glycerol-3-phosphate acyltransferase
MGPKSQYGVQMVEFVYRPVVVFAKTFFRSLGVRLAVQGEQNLPLRGGAVIAINHTSYLDFAFAGIPADMHGKRLVRFMAKESVFRHPIAGPLMRGMRHIPVDREHGSAALDEAVAYLKRGEMVGVFPEATMSRSFEIKNLKTGAVRMAREANVPIIPMIVFGGQRILYYGHRDFSRGHDVAVNVGKPWLIDPNRDDEVQTLELRQQMQHLLNETLEHYPLPDDLSDAWWLPQRWGGSAPALTAENS